jgi:hypothetical protein
MTHKWPKTILRRRKRMFELDAPWAQKQKQRILGSSRNLVPTEAAARINQLKDWNPYCQRYLEIGLFRGETFESVLVAERIGVDPHPLFDIENLPSGVQVFSMSSNHFFASWPNIPDFDIAYIDGLHTYRQTYSDLINALIAVPWGPILLDDTVPDDELSAIPDQAESVRLRQERGDHSLRWHGDVWKVIVALHRFHPELHWCTIIEGENPQTVVWRSRPDVEISMPSRRQLSKVSRLKYSDVMSRGLPDFFHAASECQAIELCLTELGSQSSNHCVANNSVVDSPTIPPTREPNAIQVDDFRFFTS